MNTKNNSSIAVVIGAVMLLGLLLTIMQGMNVSAFASAPVIITPPPTKQPAAAKIEPLRTTAPSSFDETPLPTATPFVFSDVVPAADSPEASSESMGACFSMYSRNRNQTENTCLPEWYPADQSPRAGDRFWCATNGANVEWVPVRLFDNRSNQTVIPFGGCS